MRLAWCTDLHLQFCEDPVVDAFLASLSEASPDALLITGDITTAPRVCDALRKIEAALRCPVYFVLGNHDYYRGSIASVRSAVPDATRGASRLHWLRESGVIPLTADCALVGVDGWADGRLGAYATSPVMLNDYIMITELSGLSKDERLRNMQQIADEDARILSSNLHSALASHRRVIVGIHVPPFAAAAWHEGKQSDDNWLPHFSSKVAGDALASAADAHPDRELLVLCGHTHGGGTIDARPNLRVITGPAEYGKPVVQTILEIN